jgi:hypothetical protein
MLGRYIDLGNPVERGHPINRGIASWWLGMPGQQGAYLRDIAGGSHGTLTNGPSWKAGQQAPFVSLSLDGSDDHVSLGAPTSGAGLNVSGTQPFSLAAWVHISNFGKNNNLFCRDDNTLGRCFTLDWVTFTGGYRFYVNGGGSVGTDEVRWSDSASVSPASIRDSIS